MTDPDDTQAAPGFDGQMDLSTEESRSPAESRDAASTLSNDNDENDDEDISQRPVRHRFKELVALSLFMVVCLGGTVVALYNTVAHPQRPSERSPSKVLVDGTYRIDLNPSQGTARTSDGRTADAPNDRTTETDWWAIQSACSPPSCIAVGTRLDDINHAQIAAQPAPGPGANEQVRRLRLVDGNWVSDPPNRLFHDCANGLTGHDMWRVSMTLTQLADGRLKGQESDSIESNECGRSGTVLTTPFTATRVGALPAGLPPLK